MSYQMLSKEALLSENLKLRQERLAFYNLISITQDQISILQKISSENDSSQNTPNHITNQKSYSSEYKEAADFLLQEFKEAVEVDLKLIDAESSLLSSNEDMDKGDYCDLLQKIIEKKISTYNHVMLAIRATKLAKS
ncbi:unnamed protein product [Blepharisma stoltei]|uniref:Uncharacterized protein n=1 Tax=Blepharisma stoltei TaxID=1481888 RepID=A0AAU9J1D7_9CILI|nr:unnamed protein product [Blepharisma stoltei]